MYLPLALPLPAAAEAQTGAGSFLPMLIMLVLVMAVFWFFSRSQRKKQQEAMSFRDRLQVGQQVQTIGMLVGEITWIDGDTITIETTPGTSFRITRNGIRSLIEDDDEVAEADDTDEAEGHSVVTEAEAVVKGAHDADQPESAEDEKSETITLNGEEVSREDLENGGEGKKKGRK